MSESSNAEIHPTTGEEAEAVEVGAPADEQAGIVNDETAAAANEVTENEMAVPDTNAVDHADDDAPQEAETQDADPSVGAEAPQEPTVQAVADATMERREVSADAAASQSGAPLEEVFTDVLAGDKGGAVAVEADSTPHLHEVVQEEKEEEGAEGHVVGEAEEGTEVQPHEEGGAETEVQDAPPSEEAPPMQSNDGESPTPPPPVATLSSSPPSDDTAAVGEEKEEGVVSESSPPPPPLTPPANTAVETENDVAADVTHSEGGEANANANEEEEKEKAEPIPPQSEHEKAPEGIEEAEKAASHTETEEGVETGQPDPAAALSAPEQQQQQQQQETEKEEAKEDAAVPVADGNDAAPSAPSPHSQKEENNAEAEKEAVAAVVDAAEPVPVASPSEVKEGEAGEAPSHASTPAVPVSAHFATDDEEGKKEAKEESDEKASPSTTAAQDNTAHDVPSMQTPRPPPPTSAPHGTARRPVSHGDAARTVVSTAAAAAAVSQGSVSAVAGVGDMLVDFCRGADNSHTNRMVEGSYSRYLMTTDELPEPYLLESFHGTLPLTGTVPAAMYYSATQPKSASQRPVSPAPSSSSYRANGAERLVHSTSASRRSRRRDQSSMMMMMTDGSARPTTAQTSFAATMPNTLRRERELLDDATLGELCTQRERRRLLRRPLRSRPDVTERDYQYYNTKSKGYFIPPPLPDDALLLQYDHLYDFGNGTRFANQSAMDVVDGDGTQNGRSLVYSVARANPGAAPPRTIGEWKRGTARATARQQSVNAATASSRVAPQTWSASPSQRRREDIQNGGGGGASLRSARAIDVGKLHCSQFRRTRTLEETLAERASRMPATSALTGSAVHAAVQEGKLNHHDIAPQLGQIAMAEEEGGGAEAMPTRSLPPLPQNASASRGNGHSRAQRRVPAGPGAVRATLFTDRVSHPMLSAMGGRADVNAPALVGKRMATTRNSHSVGGGGGAGDVNGGVYEADANGNGSSVAAAVVQRPYGVSRLQYKKRYTPEATPSAFV